jgi:hypothetical protein
MSIFFVAAVTGALAWVLGVIIRIFPNTTLNPISGIIYTFAWLASAIIGIIVWNPGVRIGLTLAGFIGVGAVATALLAGTA